MSTLVVPAWRLRWRAPELALVLGERAVALASARRDEVDRLRAEALVVFASNRMGRGVRVADRALDALRAAETASERETAWRLRVELADSARSVGAPLTGFAAVRPVLEADDVPPGLRATALVQAGECLVSVGRGPALAQALDEADGLYQADPMLDHDTTLLHRGLLRAAAAGQHRRWGDLRAATAAAREGLEMLDRLKEPATDNGQVRGRLTVELVCALMDLNKPGEASEAGTPLLERPVRAPSASTAGWLRLVLATRVHLPAGRVDQARDLLRDAADSAERHQLDTLLAESLLALAHVHEVSGNLTEALSNLRSAHAAERRRARAVYAVRARLAAEFAGVHRQPPGGLHDELAHLLRTTATAQAAPATPDPDLAPEVKQQLRQWRPVQMHRNEGVRVKRSRRAAEDMTVDGLSAARAHAADRWRLVQPFGDAEPTPKSTTGPTPESTTEPTAGPTAEPTAGPTAGPTAEPTGRRRAPESPQPTQGRPEHARSGQARPIRPATPPAATPPLATEPPATEPPAINPATAGPLAASPAPASPAPASPAPAGPSAVEPPATGPSVTGFPASGPALTGPAPIEPSGAGPALTDPVLTDPVLTDPVLTGPAPAGPVLTGPPAAEPASTELPAPQNPGAAPGAGAVAGSPQQVSAAPTTQSVGGELPAPVPTSVPGSVPQVGTGAADVVEGATGVGGRPLGGAGLGGGGFGVVEQSQEAQEEQGAAAADESGERSVPAAGLIAAAGAVRSGRRRAAREAAEEDERPVEQGSDSSVLDTLKAAGLLDPQRAGGRRRAPDADEQAVVVEQESGSVEQPEPQVAVEPDSQAEGRSDAPADVEQVSWRVEAPARLRSEVPPPVDMFDSPTMVQPVVRDDVPPVGLGAAFVKGPVIPTARVPEPPDFPLPPLPDFAALTVPENTENAEKTEKVQAPPVFPTADVDLKGEDEPEAQVDQAQVDQAQAEPEPEPVPEPELAPEPVPPVSSQFSPSGFLSAADVEHDDTPPPAPPQAQAPTPATEADAGGEAKEPFVTAVVVGGKTIDLPALVVEPPPPADSPSATRASRRHKSDLSLAELLAEALVAYEDARREDEAAGRVDPDEATVPIPPLGNPPTPDNETTAPIQRIDPTPGRFGTWTLPEA
ncbi:hypothetical protein [Saccharothrix sp. HUAS TT1]|uniref:hypothetical protein n=1 Tax=unclassified Saccharothrix TaxID=2593673 RepID=UPI00345C5D60